MNVNHPAVRPVVCVMYFVGMSILAYMWYCCTAGSQGREADPEDDRDGDYLRLRPEDD